MAKGGKKGGTSSAGIVGKDLVAIDPKDIRFTHSR